MSDTEEIIAEAMSPPNDTNKKEYKPIPGNSMMDAFTGRLKADRENPLNSVRNFHALYGEIFRIEVFTLGFTFLSSHRMVDAMLSSPKVRKCNSLFLEELRLGAGDGLFTARNEEPNWQMAHNILIPAFGAMSVRGMWDQMVDIASSMIQRWNSHQGVAIDIPDQLTRLTLDTIALCSFDFRFNSFFNTEMHPFVQDMIDFLSASAQRTMSPLSKHVNLKLKWKWEGACKRMQEFADQIIADRKSGKTAADDLCKRMLDMADPETGEKLSPENVRYQLLTFLVAGHETTSGLLSFCLYYMVKNPQTIRKAQAEVDEIGQITLDSISKMPYIDACLKETLRLQPTAPMFSVESPEDVELPDGYTIPAMSTVMIDLHSLQTDPKVWGEDATEFRPERLLEKSLDERGKNIWKPFGNGARSCIGRAFAMQEAMLCIASILQNFDLELDNPSYELRTKFTLTIKPDDMKMKVRRREAGPPVMPLYTNAKVARPKMKASVSEDSGIEINPELEGKPIKVLYGSNAGSCEALAKELANACDNYNILAEVATLDSCLKLPTDVPIIIVTSSYEGKPCDNAKQFAAYLDSKPDLAGVKFAIFGSGHHDWVSSYMNVPRTFEAQMLACGAKALLHRGEGDVAGDFIGEFQAWKEDLFECLKKSGNSGTATPVRTPGISSLNNIKNLLFQPILSKTINADVNNSLSIGTILANDELTPASELGVSKRHITIQLPQNETYEAGDYLSILPTNPRRNVLRILKRFNLSEETKIMVKAESGASLLPIRAFDLLQDSVELAAPVPRRLLPTLAKLSNDIDAATISKLEADYQSEVLDRRVSTIDALEMAPSCTLSFDDYVKSLQTLHQRQYSISSSPLADPTRCTITIDILRGPSTSSPHHEFEGVTSNFLADLKKCDEISCSIRQSSQFHLPRDISTPIVCFAAGTGIAPFRGFLQERYLQYQAGQSIGQTVLFYGCRNETDFLHRDEILEWSKCPQITIYRTFSRVGSGQYIHDLVYEKRAEVLALHDAGASFYTCGSASKLAHSLRQTWTKMQSSAETAEERERYAAFIDSMGTNRYSVDIFN